MDRMVIISSKSTFRGSMNNRGKSGLRISTLLRPVNLLTQCLIAAEAERMKEPAPEVSSRSHDLRHVSNPTYRALCGPIRAAW